MIPSLSKLQEWRCNLFKENWNGFNSICLYKSIPCCVPLGSGTVICLVLPVFGSVTVWTSFWIGFPVFGSVIVIICPDCDEPSCVPFGNGRVICVFFPVFGSVTVWTSCWIGFPVFGSVTVTICPVAPGWIIFRAPPGWCEDVAAVDS